LVKPALVVHAAGYGHQAYQAGEKDLGSTSIICALIPVSSVAANLISCKLKMVSFLNPTRNDHNTSGSSFSTADVALAVAASESFLRQKHRRA
jgi:hypothetical protein